MEREDIKQAQVFDSTGSDEQFQNEVIRPIIKLKHEWLITTTMFYLQKNKTDFLKLSAEKQVSYLDSVFQKDTAFRQFLLGAVVSEFTMSELKLYYSSNNDFNKRIYNIALKRITDSLNELCNKLA